MAIPGAGERKPRGTGGSSGMSPGERELVDRAKEAALGSRGHRNDDPNRDGDGSEEPTGIRGLLEDVEVFFNEDLAGPPQGGPGTGGSVQGPENNQPRPILRPNRQPEEEEIIIPGDPDDLGERARRRRSRDDVNTSPVLRRGLLGV